jgi:hypothetical protein
MSISSCKLCGKNKPKVARSKTASGFIGKYNDETMRHWIGRVCDECVPTLRKTKYRPKQVLPEQRCEGCGVMYKPSRKTKRNVCSSKCGMRVLRNQSQGEMGRINPVKLKLE